MADGNFGYGWIDPFDTSSEVGTAAAVTRRIVARIQTMMPVKVKAVTGGGGAVAAAGTVDVIPLVNQLDGNKNPVKHGAVHGIPWWRLQGGAGSVVCDPEVGDVGMIFSASRDISNVGPGGAQVNPGSFRKHDFADSVYLGGIFNAAPAQWLRFIHGGGLELVDSLGNKYVGSSGGIDLTPASGQDVTVHGPAHVTGNALLDGTLGVGGNALLNGTLGVTGQANFAAGVGVAGALTALSAQFNGGATIKRILAGSVSFSTPIPANSVTLVAAPSIPGTKVGDLVLLSQWELGGAVVVQPVAGVDLVNVFVTNPTGSIQSASLNSTILVIGIT